MGWNVPDDWNSWYRSCSYCGGRYHASEGGCGCLEEHEQCHLCQNEPVGYYGDRREAEGWHHIDQLVELGDKYFCAEHEVCGCCDEKPKGEVLTWDEDADLLLCPKCGPETHYCAKDGPLLDHIERVTRPE